MSNIAEIIRGASVKFTEDQMSLDQMSLDLETIAPLPEVAETQTQAPPQLETQPTVRPGTTADDFALLRRFAEFSDPQAFAQIVQKYASFVYATCLRVIGDGSRAEDLSQETFFRLMRRPHEVRQNLGGWLHRTATHLALDSLRSETSRRKREITYTLECDHEASTWAELSPVVDQALADMPEEYRVLLVEHFLLGKTQAEIAEETEQSPSTVSRRMHQALAELRRHLRLKGVFALPVALAGLLCHVTARQAPANLVTELGKMAMVSGCGAASRTAQFGSPHPKYARTSLRVWLSHISPPLVLAVAGMIGMLILLRVVTAWLSTKPAPDPDQMPHAKSKTASAMVIWGSSVEEGQYSLATGGGHLQKSP